MKTILKPGLIACMLLAGGVSLFAAFANDAEAGKAAREAVAKKDLAAYEKIFKERLAQKKLSSDILNLYTNLQMYVLFLLVLVMLCYYFYNLLLKLHLQLRK